MIDNLENNVIDEDSKPQDAGKSKRIAYLLLIGLSILSALAVMSPWLIRLRWPPPNPSDLGALIYALKIIGAQWLLVIPATLLVFFVYKGIARLTQLAQLYRIKTWAQFEIPLLFNVLSASYIFLLACTSEWVLALVIILFFFRVKSYYDD
jgi:hypothetical protein